MRQTTRELSGGGTITALMQCLGFYLFAILRFFFLKKQHSERLVCVHVSVCVCACVGRHHKDSIIRLSALSISWFLLTKRRLIVGFNQRADATGDVSRCQVRRLRCRVLAVNRLGRM